jgi:hypothetical protein
VFGVGVGVGVGEVIGSGTNTETVIVGCGVLPQPTKEHANKITRIFFIIPLWYADN